MGIRVLRADGVLEVVDRIVAYAEKSGVWNGKARRTMERAVDGVGANALVFCVYPKNFTVGNLPADQLLDIQQEALERGCVDLSMLDCQIVTKEKAILGVKPGKPYFFGADNRASRAENQWVTRMEEQGDLFGAFPCNNGFGGMGSFGNMGSSSSNMEGGDEEGVEEDGIE